MSVKGCNSEVTYVVEVIIVKVLLYEILHMVYSRWQGLCPIFPGSVGLPNVKIEKSK